eukprot:CAMPEP_0206530634 /NCGR_PEP_ID=MMETSP0325_2-20121206/3288_1 /ASSEMBLY_ACC=CAM_ASM_000347 /TAXON_ID=2866 /ORGANISM="Crypthecodinium cohnii, Strain Seligo" /LENGTH=96 /DNA_ID=CAMNT_0054026727 /DNA_START=116 /DNA_END=406 /DNA_ORIENTATION=+
MSFPSQYTATEAPAEPHEHAEESADPESAAAPPSASAPRGKRTGRKKLARQRLSGSPFLFVADSLRPSVHVVAGVASVAEVTEIVPKEKTRMKRGA